MEWYWIVLIVLVYLASVFTMAWFFEDNMDFKRWERRLFVLFAPFVWAWIFFMLLVWDSIVRTYRVLR